MAQRRLDEFANVAIGNILQSGLNTNDFYEVLTGTNLGRGQGILIDQIDYYADRNVLAEFVASGDELKMALTTRSDITDLADYGSRQIIDAFLLYKILLTSGTISYQMPVSHKFDPPLIFAGPRLFFAVGSLGFAAAREVSMRMYFRYIDLTPAQYLELAENFILT